MERAILEIAKVRMMKYCVNDPSKQERFPQHKFFFYSIKEFLKLIFFSFNTDITDKLS